MGSFSVIPLINFMSSPVYEQPGTVRGRTESGGFFSLMNEPLETDSEGSMQLILRNVVVGSTYDVEVISTGEKLLAGTAALASFSLSIPYYASGNARNELRLKIRKASEAPFYQSYETQLTAGAGSQSIFINQLSDE